MTFRLVLTGRPNFLGCKGSLWPPAGPCPVVGSCMLLFSKSGWHAHVLSPVPGSVGNFLASLARPIKHGLRMFGTIVEASCSLRSPHSSTCFLLAGDSDEIGPEGRTKGRQ